MKMLATAPGIQLNWVEASCKDTKVSIEVDASLLENIPLSSSTTKSMNGSNYFKFVRKIAKNEKCEYLRITC